jgi:hypothetical protein
MACGSTSLGCGGPLPANVTGRSLRGAPPCNVLESVNTDQNIYTPASSIGITLTAKNISTVFCPDDTQCADVVVRGPIGRVVWKSPGICDLVYRQIGPSITASFTYTAALSVRTPGIYSAKATQVGFDTAGKRITADDYGTAFFTVCG